MGVERIIGKVIEVSASHSWFYSKWVSYANIASKGKLYTILFDCEDYDTFGIMNDAKNSKQDVDIQAMLRIDAYGNEVYEIVKERE